ncbi:hypothetical protein [Lactobacillus sp. PSON]|uniref:hypothetical protein n=1 Tax=Lactobacillus sp. PSON TaxID=3455454 RepID=UPI0040436596
MQEKTDKTREILAIHAAEKANNAGSNEVVWINPPAECVLVPTDYSNYEELVISLILHKKLDERDLSYLFDYFDCEDDSERACKLYIQDNYEVENNDD